MDNYEKQFELYNKIGDKLVNENKLIEKSQMFGKPCFKINGKAFAAFFKGVMVFKIGSEDQEELLKLKGTERWDPSGKKRPMKEWICVPSSYYKEWGSLAKKSLIYVHKDKT